MLNDYEVGYGKPPKKNRLSRALAAIKRDGPKVSPICTPL